MINIIVAYDQHRVIGHRGKIPWHLPEDMKHFTQTTTGSIVIMGRKTWESIPEKYRPLKNRLNIILSSNPDHDSSNVCWYSNIDDILKDIKKVDTYVIGGESVYREFLRRNLVDRVIASEVHQYNYGDKFFPTLDSYGEWNECYVKGYKDFNIVEYTKVR